MPKGAARYRSMTMGKQAGELARLRALGGPDAGVVFVITAARVTIGRGEESDVLLADLKTSRKHAELFLAQGGQAWTLRDLGSTHGLLVNGVPYRTIGLKSGDKIGMGETVLEFIANETGATRLIQMPSRVSPTVGTGVSGLTGFIPRPTGQAAPSAAAGRKSGVIEGNKRLIFILGVLLAVATALPEVEKKKIARRNKYLDLSEIEGERGLSSLAPPPAADPAITRQADLQFKEGFREYRARNYLRAQACFETALQIYGGHDLARIYLESTRKAMVEEAKEHLKTAKRDEEAHRLRSAMNHYGAVKRLFAKDQTNDLYKQADKLGAEADKKMREAEK